MNSNLVLLEQAQSLKGQILTYFGRYTRTIARINESFIANSGNVMTKIEVLTVYKTYHYTYEPQIITPYTLTIYGGYVSTDNVMAMVKSTPQDMALFIRIRFNNAFFEITSIRKPTREELETYVKLNRMAQMMTVNPKMKLNDPKKRVFYTLFHIISLQFLKYAYCW